MEQKHYTYAATATLNAKTGKVGVDQDKPQVVEVKSVEFFTPVRVYMDVDGEEVQETAHIDYANKRIFFESKLFDTDEIREKVFSHLWKEANPPENQYEPGDEIYDQVARAREEYDKVNVMKEGNGPCQTE